MQTNLGLFTLIVRILIYIDMDKKKMIIKKIESSESEGLSNLFLQEENGERMLNIIIGEYEAQKMAITIDKIYCPRPLTYDLFYDVLKSYNIVIEEVIITKFFEGVYYSSIACTTNSETKVFDARTSDAINMALKYNSPIFASEEILKEVGFLPKDITKNRGIKEIKIFLDTQSEPDQIKEFEKLLEIAVEDEDYDAAADLRDRIEKLKQELDNKKDKE